MEKHVLRIVEYQYGPYRIRKVQGLWYFHRIGEPIQEYGRGYTSAENCLKKIHRIEKERINVYARGTAKSATAS